MGNLGPLARRNVEELVRMKYRRKHLAFITPRRQARYLFRKRYFVRCYNCPLDLGPYSDSAAARRGLALAFQAECRP